MKKLVLLLMMITGLYSSINQSFAEPATVTVRTNYTLPGYPVPNENFTIYVCKCPHTAAQCTCRCVDITTTVLLSFEGGNYKGNLHFDSGMIKEYHSGLPGVTGEEIYYPNPAGYTFYEGAFLEINECGEFPELEGFTIDLNGITTDANGNIAISFTLE